MICTQTWADSVFEQREVGRATDRAIDRLWHAARRLFTISSQFA
jgi:hypothetical protein